MALCLTNLYLCALSIPHVPPFIEISIDGTFVESTDAISTTSDNTWNLDYCIQIDKSSTVSLTTYAEDSNTSYLYVEFSQINPIIIENNGNFTRYYDEIEPAVNYLNGRVGSCTEYINYTITGLTSDPVVPTSSPTDTIYQTSYGIPFCLTEISLCAVSIPPVPPFIEISIDHTFIESTHATSTSSDNKWNFDYCIDIEKSSKISPLTVYAEDASTSFLYVEFSQMNPIVIENNGNFTRYYDEIEPAANYLNGRIAECTEYVKYTVSGLSVHVSTTSVHVSTTPVHVSPTPVHVSTTSVHVSNIYNHGEVKSFGTLMVCGFVMMVLLFSK